MRSLALCCSALLAASAPSLASASDDYGHDDSNRSPPAARPAAVPGGVAGPKAAQLDDAPYPDAAPEPAERSGVGFAFAGGPEPYAHDDASYGPGPEGQDAPSSQGAAGTMASLGDDPRATAGERHADPGAP